MKDWWEEFSEVCNKPATGWCGVYSSIYMLATVGHKVAVTFDETEEEVRWAFLSQVRYMASKIRKVVEAETLSNEMKVKILAFSIAHGILDLEKRKRQQIMKRKLALNERIVTAIKQYSDKERLIGEVVGIIDEEMDCRKTENWL
jgi:hypothetical protein